MRFLKSGFKSFTRKNKGDIISIVRVKGVLKIAVAALCAATVISVGGVFAAEGTATVYPEDFERELTFTAPIKDYAVCGDTVAFAYNTSICILSYDESGERKRSEFIHESEIAMLDGDDEGNLYFRNSSGSTYLYSAKPTAVESHEFQSLTSSHVALSDSVFYTLERGDGTLDYWNDGTRNTVGDGFSIMKKYGGVIYAVKDNAVASKPALYKIEGGAATELDLSYTDFKDADHIKSGDAATALKAENYQVKTAIINRGAYRTQIDPEQTGEYFKQIYTKKTEGDIPCLVLCESGNASLVATNEGCFITATADLTDYEYTPPANDWQINEAGIRAAYAVTSVGVYASPFMSTGTRIATLESGAEHYVTVTEKFTLDFLDKVFYRVTYTEDGKTVSGFVAADFLTPYNFAAEDKKPTEGGDEEFQYDTNVTSVILAVIIVGLVIIAILYLTLVSSKKDGKKTKKEKTSKKKPEDNSDN